MFGVAVLNNKKQVDAYKTQYRVQFPIMPDEKGEGFEALGKPLTPFLILATREGKVLMTHAGLINDVDELLAQIRKIHKQP